MEIRTVVPESANIAHVDHFPAEGDALPVKDEHALVAHGTVLSTDIDTWHCRLGHLNVNTILQMAHRGMVKGMAISGTSTHTLPCKPCIKGKQTQAEIQKHTEMRANTVLGHVFSDVCGKLPTCSHKGFDYFMTFIDDKLHKVFITGLHRKSDVTQQLKALITCVEVETGQCVKILHLDGEGKYTEPLTTQYLASKRTNPELTMP